MKKLVFLFLVVVPGIFIFAQDLKYPYEVRYITLNIEKKPVKMAYMDVPGKNLNGKTVVLLHGKNFNGYYWKNVISFLQGSGYRVIVPDQVGWGLSDKPNIHYSFHLLARNTKQLLDSLGIHKIFLVGHSMGGMLAARFTLMYPEMIEKLVFENPIGLEDYKTFVPYRSTDEQFESELKATPESIAAYQHSYYPVWQPGYKEFADIQYNALQYPDFKTATWASALTYQMIYEQPVIYEMKNIKATTLIIIGQADRTIVGKNLLDQNTISQHGQYPELGKQLQALIPQTQLIALDGVGHIPHIQVPGIFLSQLKLFFEK
jgi:pimeloyl-ACP methyl ester carboxylesterase